MRAIQITQNGGPDVLTPTDLPDPVPGAGEVVVEVAAAGVNFIDTYFREGIYPKPLPFVAGQEGAGRITAVGDGVDDLAVGDRVAWAQVFGSYATRVAVPAGKAVPIPDGVDEETAVAIMVQGMTAQVLVTDTYAVQAGDDVLVHAAAGGVGLLLTQLASAKGARVIATTSTPEKAELARAAGAADVVDYTQVDDLAAAVRELTEDVGVDVVYDGVGASTFDASLASLRTRGLLVLYGAASGPVPPFDPQRLNAAGSVYLTRPTVFHYLPTPGALRAKAAEVFDLVAAGQLDVRIGNRFPLAEAGAAHEALQGRRTTGKVLLIP